MTDPEVARTLDDIRQLLRTPRLRVDLAQVRSRALFGELGGDDSGILYTFEPNDVWRRWDLVFSDAARLLRRDDADRAELLEAIRQVAEAFEFLATNAEEGDKEKLLLCAAISYHIAGYQANAQCLARAVQRSCLPDEPRRDRGLDAALIDLFRFSLVALLRRDLPQLRQLLLSATDTIDHVQSLLVSLVESLALDSTGVIAALAHGYYYDFLRNFVSYCEDGDASALDRVHVSLEKSCLYFDKLRDVTPAVLVSELRTAVRLFSERSTWQCLRTYSPGLATDPVWEAYLRRMAVDKSIVEFWTSQLTALEAGLLSSSDSFVIQMPTSAGKTLIAELAILAALTSRPGSHCLYIAPYRALVNEVQATLADDLGAIGYRVSSLLGGFEYDDFLGFLLTESDVLIATPEKAEILLRSHPEYFSEVSVVVIDEGHIIDEGIPESSRIEGDVLARLSRQGSIGRGVLLEFLVTRLRRRLPEARFLYLSAVMPATDAQDFVDWLSVERGAPLSIDARQRPARQVTARFQWRSAQNGQLEFISLPRLASGQRPFVPYFIARKQYLTGGTTPTGRPERRSFPDTNNKAQTTAMLAARFAPSGPVLVFCAQKSHVRQVVEALIECLQYLEENDALNSDDLRFSASPSLQSYHEAVEWLGEDHLLSQGLHRRIGLHFGPLPEGVRQAVEDDFRAGRIRILVSTNTLGQGVNMPVRTALIHSLERIWPDKAASTGVRSERVKRRDFLNICGRAGRAGKETEGLIVFVTVSDHDEELFREYSQNTEEVLASALFRLLELLTDLRISSQDLIGYLDPQVLAILAEEAVDTTDEASIREFLGSSLVGVQAIRRGVDLAPLAAAFVAVSAWVMERVPSNELLRAFSSTGLRVASCESLLVAVDEFIGSLAPDWKERLIELRTCDFDLLRAAFSACSELPEMQPTDDVLSLVVGEEIELVDAWVRGNSIGVLRTSFWSAGHGEEFAQYLGDRATYRLPWGINSFLSLLALRLEVDFADLPRCWRHLSAMMKYGVDNVVACWARDLGIARNLAIQLAQEFHLDETSSFASFIRWLGNQPIEFLLALEGSDAAKSHMLDVVMGLVPSSEILALVREKTTALISPVRGTPYHGRHLAASRVREGDALRLEPEPTNPHDRYAVRVLYGEDLIGYVQRDRARFVFGELQRGLQARASAVTVRPPREDHPWPWIEIRIVLE